MNDQVIAEFRANSGHVQANNFGRNLVLVHHIGRKSGEERVTPLVAITDDSSWLITASAAGKTENPPWYLNLLAAPATTIEIPAGSGTETVSVSVAELEGDERDSAWARFTSRFPSFADYVTRAGDRTIPVLRLTQT